jgi:hypothetical protein
LSDIQPPTNRVQAAVGSERFRGVFVPQHPAYQQANIPKKSKHTKSSLCSFHYWDERAEESRAQAEEMLDGEAKKADGPIAFHTALTGQYWTANPDYRALLCGHQWRVESRHGC